MVGLKPTEIPPSAPIKFLSAGTAACIADLCTFPLDTAKVRLQIQGESRTCKASRQVKYKGVLGTITTMVKMEGPKSLYKGLVAGLQRQMSFASVRIGLYDSVKDLYTPKGSERKYQHIHPSFLAGCTTGAMAVTCAQPTDVVKVRFQAHIQLVGRSTEVHTRDRGWPIEQLLPGKKESEAFGKVPVLFPNRCHRPEVFRHSLVASPTFLLAVATLLLAVRCRFVRSTVAVFPRCSRCDVVKTRCMVTMVVKEGPNAFFKGFIPSFLRLGSWNVVMFVSYEQLKRLMVLAQVSWEAPF
uniref:Uncharacterized protein n=1 Tax=Laticauda laticaudata TaxID=8630 RepID=A0A8C5WQ48_LATLA